MADKEAKDKAYAEGVKDGKNDNSLGDIVQGLGLGSSSIDKDLRGAYDKGHDFGREHRYDGSQRDRSAKITDTKSSSESSSTREHGDSDKSYYSGSDYSSPSSQGRVEKGRSGSKVLSVIIWILSIYIGFCLLTTLVDVLNEASRHHRWPFHSHSSASSSDMKMVYPKNGSVVTERPFSLQFQNKKSTFPHLIPYRVLGVGLDDGNLGVIEGEYSSDYGLQGIKKFSWTPKEPLKNGKYYVRIGKYDFSFIVNVPSSK